MLEKKQKKRNTKNLDGPSDKSIVRYTCIYPSGLIHHRTKTCASRHIYIIYIVLPIQWIHGIKWVSHSKNDDSFKVNWSKPENPKLNRLQIVSDIDVCAWKKKKHLTMAKIVYYVCSNELNEYIYVYGSQLYIHINKYIFKRIRFLMKHTAIKCWNLLNWNVSFLEFRWKLINR